MLSSDAAKLLAKRRPRRRGVAGRQARSVIAAVVLSALVLAGCGSEGDSAGASSEPESGETRVVETPQGKVEIPEDPKRVIVLNHALAGYLYELDIPVQATIPEAVGAPEEYSQFWADQAEEDGTEFLPWTADGFALEEIAAMEPDLIVGGGVGFPYAQGVDAYDALTKIAPTVLVNDKLATWQKQSQYLAEDVFDMPDRYEELEVGYEKRLAEVKKSITVPPSPVAYLAFTSDDKTFALVENQGLPQEMARLGFKPAPIFADNDLKAYGGSNDMFEISPELMSEVVTMPTVFATGFNGETFDLDDVREDPIYATLPSFKNDQVYELPYWAVRADYHEAMGLLDELEKQFG